MIALQQQLQDQMNQQHLNYDRVEASRHREEIRRTWQQEEQYWAIRSRIQWLKWDDNNMRFFHASTLPRRQRNHITMLQDEEHQWVRDTQTLQSIRTISFPSYIYLQGIGITGLYLTNANRSSPLK